MNLSFIFSAGWPGFPLDSVTVGINTSEQSQIIGAPRAVGRPIKSYAKTVQKVFCDKEVISMS